MKESIVHFDAINQLFITRVPQTLKEAKGLIAQAHTLDFVDIIEGYQGVWHDSHYGDVAQKWLLVRSEQATKREGHNLNKRMLKQCEQGRQSFKKLCQQEFGCQEDAKTALAQWEAKQPYLMVDSQINNVPVYAGAGRPSKGALPTRAYYQVTGRLYTALSKRADALQQLGLFIIASNDLADDLSMEKILSTYKSQQSVEKGFRFLKSPDFLTSAIYLKKPERIEALLMVMTSCLMVYASKASNTQTVKRTKSFLPKHEEETQPKPNCALGVSMFSGDYPVIS